MVPPDLMPGGDLRLGFDGGFAFVFRQSDGSTTWATDLCEWVVAADSKEQLLMISSRTGDRVDLPLLTPALTEYPVFRLPNEPACIVVFTMEFYAPGARLWWQANCLPPLMVANTRGKPSAWLLDLWPCWKRGFGEFFPPSVGFVKGVPRGRNDIRPWHRWPLEHCLSTLALVWLFACRANLARPFESRSKIRDNFKVFLDTFFSEECLIVEVAIDDCASVAVGSPGVCGNDIVKLPLDYGKLGVKGLLDHDSLMSKKAFRLFEQCDGFHGGRLDVPLGEAIAKVVTSGILWLARQLVLQVAIAVEMTFPERQFTQNVCDVLSELPATHRWNDDLKDALVMGKVPTGAGDIAFVPSQHAQSALAFHGKRRKLGTGPRLSFSRAENGLLTRYSMNSQAHFGGCRNLALSADATRLGGAICDVGIGRRAERGVGRLGCCLGAPTGSHLWVARCWGRFCLSATKLFQEGGGGGQELEQLTGVRRQCSSPAGGRVNFGAQQTRLPWALGFSSAELLSSRRPIFRERFLIEAIWFFSLIFAL